MRNPHISVLMGVYNGEQFVARAVASILAQTFSDFELIVINDGSTDSTLTILESFRDSRLRVITHENRGLTRGLNEAAAVARGRWFARQDADDLSIVTRFEKQVAFLKCNEDVKLLGSSVFMSNRHGMFNEIFDYPQSDAAVRQAFAVLNPFCHGAVIIERGLFEQVGGYDETYRWAQDYDLWGRLLPRCKAGNLAAPLYGRVRHGATSESTVAKDVIATEVRALTRAASPELFRQPSPASFPIGTRNAHPIVATPAVDMASLGATYWRIARELRSCSLPAVAESALSFLYCPWWPLRSNHAHA
jgi:Glycosyl transferase family 2